MVSLQETTFYKSLLLHFPKLSVEPPPIYKRYLQKEIGKWKWKKEDNIQTENKTTISKLYIKIKAMHILLKERNPVLSKSQNSNMGVYITSKFANMEATPV